MWLTVAKQWFFQISSDFTLALPWLCGRFLLVYGLLFCVFQHLSRGCLRINMALTYWQALVTPPSLSLLSLFVWLMEAKPEFYRETSDEQILMLAKMVNIFTQRERGTMILGSIRTLFYSGLHLRCNMEFISWE